MTFVPSQKDLDSLDCPQNQLYSSQFHLGYIPEKEILISIY